MTELPIPPNQWRLLIESLDLPPQQARIVELILCNRCDKQIAMKMGLRIPTVRTYLTRVYRRLGVSGRMELVLKLFALSHEKAASRHDDIIANDLT